MKVHFKNGDDIIYAEQDKRGRREEADVDVYINGVLIMRRRFPKCESKEQLIEIAKRYIGGLNNGKHR